MAEIEAETANLLVACRSAMNRNDSELLTRALVGFPWLIVASSRVGLFVQLVREVLALAEPGSLLRGRALACLGVASTWRGIGEVTGEVVASLEEAIEVLQRHEAGEDVAHVQRFLGMALLRLGRVAEAREVWQRARSLHAALGDAEGETMMLNNLGDTAPTFDEAVAVLRSASAFGVETGALFPAALAANGLGSTLFRRQGASPEAVAALEQAVELAVRAGVPHVEQRNRRLLAEVLAANGALGTARAAIEAAVTRCRPSGGEQAVQDLLAARALEAWIGWLSSDGEVAQRAAASTLVRPSDPPSLAPAPPPASEALARLVVGRLALDRGDVVAAAAELALGRAAACG